MEFYCPKCGYANSNRSDIACSMCGYVWDERAYESLMGKKPENGGKEKKKPQKKKS